MTITSGFFNSLSGDRTYNAEQFSSLFEGIITDGVFMAVGDGLLVTPNIGMNVSVGSGRAWFNNSWLNNDSTAIISIDPSEVVLDRIDAIVIEINLNDSVRENTIKCVKGTPGSNPENPLLTNSEFVHQYPLAYIRINANVSSITYPAITNMIGSGYCPYITGIIETPDVATLFRQFEASFMNWFDEMKNQLSTDAAGSLQNQLDDIESFSLVLEGRVDGLDNLYQKINGVWHKQLWLASFKPTKTSGCGDMDQLEMPTNKNVYDYSPFDPSTQEYAYINAPLPFDYNGGNIYFRPYWMHPPTTTNFKVSWGLQACSFSNDDTLDYAQTTPIYSNDIGGTTYDLYIGDLSGPVQITGTPVAGDLVQFRLTRKADDTVNDTLAVDAYLIGYMVWYPVGS